MTYNRELVKIKWVALPHCPEKQLTKPGKVTDAGFDIRAAKSMFILPFNQLEYEWERCEDYMEVPEEIHDSFAVEDGVLYRKKYKKQLVPTGIKIQPEDLIWTAIYNRSSNPLNYNYTLSNAVGVIDPSYGNEIFVALTTWSEPTFISKGERIAQLVPTKQLLVELERVDEEQFTNSRAGFGSTGNV